MTEQLDDAAPVSDTPVVSSSEPVAASEKPKATKKAKSKAKAKPAIAVLAKAPKKAKKAAKKAAKKDKKAAPKAAKKDKKAAPKAAKKDKKPKARVHGRTGWRKYTGKQEIALVSLLKKHGVTVSVQIMREKKGEFADLRPAVFSEPQLIGAGTLVGIAEKNNLKNLPQGKRGRPVGWSKYSPKQEQAMGKLVAKYGYSRTQRILAGEESEALNGESVFDEPTSVSSQLLSKIVEREEILVPRTHTSFYSAELSGHIVALVKKHGLKATMVLLNGTDREIAAIKDDHDKALPKRNAKFCPERLSISEQTVRNFAKAGGVEFANRGWPVKFKGALAKYMIGLLRKHGIRVAMEILGNTRGSYAKLRNKNLCPKPIKVSYSLLNKMAKTEKLTLPRRRKSAAA